MTIIIDYGLGNLGSILNILHIIGEKASISKDPEVILNADRLILPGVHNEQPGFYSSFREMHIMGYFERG